MCMRLVMLAIEPVDGTVILHGACALLLGAKILLCNVVVVVLGLCVQKQWRARSAGTINAGDWPPCAAGQEFRLLRLRLLQLLLLLVMPLVLRFSFN